MAVQKTGKRVVLQVDGSVEVCRVTISRYLNAPVRVGSSYRVGYNFIYFPVVVPNTGKRVVPLPCTWRTTRFPVFGTTTGK